MKSVLYVIAIIFLSACTNSAKKTDEAKELSDLERIAQAHGIDKFAELEELKYTFNVQRDTVLFSRSWIWHKTDKEITAITKTDTVSYNQQAISETLKKTDHQFINDKYWLLFPFQLVWDANITYLNKGLQPAPISNKQLTMLSIQYGDAGYTPGDAYDIYVDEDWLIREWVFRKSGQVEPSLATTWEGYQDFKGIKVATEHRNKDGSFRLFFSEISFE